MVLIGLLIFLAVFAFFGIIFLIWCWKQYRSGPSVNDVADGTTRQQAGVSTVYWTSNPRVPISRTPSNLVNPYSYENTLPAAWPSRIDTDAGRKADSVKPSAPQPATPADLADPNSPKLPPSVWSITGQPAAGNKATIKIIRDHPLIIKNILDEGVVIPWQTKQRHLYAGKNDLTRERVIEMSKNSDWTEKKDMWNTVFEEPSEFWMCETSDVDNPTIIISRQPVRAFFCTCIAGQWSVENLGSFHVIFNSTAIKFIGYLYKDVIFCQ